MTGLYPDDELVLCPCCEGTGRTPSIEGTEKCMLCRPFGERYSTGKVGVVPRLQSDRFKAAAAEAMLTADPEPEPHPMAVDAALNDDVLDASIYATEAMRKALERGDR